MNWTLGLDCSSVEMGLGLVGDGSAVGGFSRYVASSHAEHISRALEFLLGTNDVPADKIERIGVAVGPGSFTGLRIALAFVKGLGLERPVKVLPVSSLQSLAMAWSPLPCAGLTVAFDARRSEVFWARFERRGQQLVRTHDDTLSSGDEFVGGLREGDTVVTDTLGFARSDVFTGLAERGYQHYPVERFPVQRGLSCARLAGTEPDDSPAWVRPRDVQPTYLRPPYAEERRKQVSSRATSA